MVTRKVRIELGGGGNGPTKPKREKTKGLQFQTQGILAHRTSDDERGVCIHLQNSRYLSSFTILRR